MNDLDEDGYIRHSHDGRAVVTGSRRLKKKLRLKEWQSDFWYGFRFGLGALLAYGLVTGLIEVAAFMLYFMP